MFINIKRLRSLLKDIQPDGTKKFMPGGKVQGGYFTMGNFDNDKISIGEGFATLATIHKAEGKPCVVSFNSGNLKRVAEIIKEQYPYKTISIVADNDLSTKKNGVRV